MTDAEYTNAQLAQALRAMLADLAAPIDQIGPAIVEHWLWILKTAAARLGARRVVLTPNTAQAAAAALRSAADAADALAQTDPRDLVLPEDLARELVERSEGDGDAWREIARRIDSAIGRDGGEPDRPALVCAVHIYAALGEAPPADTVLGGVAVCMDHIGLVAQGEDWHAIMRAAGGPARM